MPTVTSNNLSAFNQQQLQQKGYLTPDPVAPALADQDQYGPMDALMISIGKGLDDSLSEMKMAYHTTRQNMSRVAGDKEGEQLHQQRIDDIQKDMENKNSMFQPLANTYPDMTIDGNPNVSTNMAGLARLGRMLATQPVDTLSHLLHGAARMLNSPQGKSNLQNLLTPSPVKRSSGGIE